MNQIRCGAMVLVLCCSVLPAGAAGEYTMIDLGILDCQAPPCDPTQGPSGGMDINRYGQVVGFARGWVANLPASRPIAITPDDGVWYRDDDADGINDLMFDLQEGIETGDGNTGGMAFGVNDHQQVVGVWDLRPMFWDGSGGGVWLDAPTVLPEGTAFDINNAGEIAGRVRDPDRPNGPNALICCVPSAWQGGGGSYEVLAHPSSNFTDLIDRANSVSDSGIFGGIATDGGRYQALLWNPGVTNLSEEWPTAYGGSVSSVNNHGQALVWFGFNSNITSIREAYLWLPQPAYGMDAGMQRLPTLLEEFAAGDSERSEINDSGQIAAGRHLWLPEPAYGLAAGLHDLDDLVIGVSVEDVNANAINEWGQIVGEAKFDGSGLRHAFLMNPTGFSPPPPPFGIEANDRYEYSGEDGDPINTFTGELVARDLVDHDLGGPLPLRFVRYYASALHGLGVTGRLGHNWRHNFEWELQVADGKRRRDRRSRREPGLRRRRRHVGPDRSCRPALPTRRKRR